MMSLIQFKTEALTPTYEQKMLVSVSLGEGCSCKGMIVTQDEAASDSSTLFFMLFLSQSLQQPSIYYTWRSYTHGQNPPHISLHIYIYNLQEVNLAPSTFVLDAIF